VAGGRLSSRENLVNDENFRPRQSAHWRQSRQRRVCHPLRPRHQARLGELLEAEQKAGRLATQERGRPREASSTTTLSDHGISRDRAARAKHSNARPHRDPRDRLALPMLDALARNVAAWNFAAGQWRAKRSRIS